MSYFKIDNSQKHAKIKNLIKSAPKAQLHLHLDGCLSFEFMMASLKRLKERRKDFIAFEEGWEPSNEDELVSWMMKLGQADQVEEMKTGESENWKTFTICGNFLQTKIDLVEATYDIVTRMALYHNVNYIEVRFAPILHINEGLKEEEAVLAALEGFHKAKKELGEKHINVSGGLILCALRSYPLSDAINVVKLIQKINDDSVLAFDIAGDEGSYPLKLFEDAIKLALDSKIKVTIHAGEWNENDHQHIIDNLRLAVDLGVHRIGHGLALRSLDLSDDIFSKMSAKNISVEVCLTSNCDNHAKCKGFDLHPLSKFLKHNVLIAGLNVDNLLLAGNTSTGLPDPSGEFTRAIVDCGITPEELLVIVENSYRAAFQPLSESIIQHSINVWKEKVIPNLNS